MIMRVNIMQSARLRSSLQRYLGYGPMAALAVILFGVSANITSGLKPLILDSHVRFINLSISGAGDVISIEFLFGAIACYLVSLKIATWNRFYMAFGAIVLMLCGNLGAAYSTDVFGIYASRLIAGIGHGAGYGVLAGAIAGSHSPERLGSAYTVVAMSTVMLASFAAPTTQSIVGSSGLYILILLAVCLGAITLPFFPKRPSSEHVDLIFKNDVSVEASRFAVASVLVGTLFYFMAVGGVWPYFGQLMQANDVAYDVSSKAIGYATAASIAGALCAAGLGVRYGRILPIAGALLLQICALSAPLIFPSVGMVYIVSSICFMFGWLFFFPYLLGLLSILDPYGKICSRGYTIALFCFGFGPFLAARLVSMSGLYLVLWMGLFFLLFAFVIFVATLRRMADVSRDVLP